MGNDIMMDRASFYLSQLVNRFAKLDSKGKYKLNVSRIPKSHLEKVYDIFEEENIHPYFTRFNIKLEVKEIIQHLLSKKNQMEIL